MERDALQSERDTMRADHAAVKQQLAEADSKLADLATKVEAQTGQNTDGKLTPKLAELADALEKCATELEQRVSAT